MNSSPPAPVPAPATGPAGRRSLVAVSAVGLVLLAGLGAWIAVKVGQKKSAEAERTAERERTARAAAHPVPVGVMRPGPASWTPEVVLTGTLEPIQAADLAFEVGGRVAHIDARLGDHVEAGQLLAALDRATIGAQQAQTAASVSAAEAQAAIAQDRLTRAQSLARTGAASDAELVGARQNVALAQAQLAQARATRRLTSTTSADHVLRAPFAGVLTRVPSGPGGVVGPGVPLLRVEDLTALKLRGTVAADEVSAIANGATVHIEGTRAVGTVRAVVRSLDPSTRRAPIEILVPNDDGSLVGNALVHAHLSTGEAIPALRIPASARRADGTVAVVSAAGRIDFRAITAHVAEDGSWLVTEGLRDGERVVVRPTDRLEQGAEVPVTEVSDTAARAAAAPEAPAEGPQARNAARPR